MKKYMFLLVFLMIFTLSGCTEDENDFLGTSAYEDYMTTYWSNKVVDYSIHSYRMEYSLPKYLTGNEEELYNTLEEIREWLRVNDTVDIKGLIPYYDSNGKLTNFDIIFEASEVSHDYKIALSNYNYNVGNYISSMFVGEEKENGYYFIIYDAIENTKQDMQEDNQIEVKEEPKEEPNEFIEENNVESDKTVET